VITEQSTAQEATRLLEVAEKYAKPQYRELVRSIREYYEKYGTLSESQCKVITNTLHFQVLHPVKVKNV
jgi:hypothetical protein